METKAFCAGIHDQFVEAEADHADDGESEKLSSGVLNPALPENPSCTQQVIANQAEDKSYRGGPKVRQPGLLGEKPQAAVINHERDSSDNGISQELPDKTIGLILQYSLK